MVEAIAESWRENGPRSVELFHIGTDGWIDKSLTCDGMHPTTEGVLEFIIQQFDNICRTGHENIGAKLVECLDARGLV